MTEGGDDFLQLLSFFFRMNHSSLPMTWATRVGNASKTGTNYFEIAKARSLLVHSIHIRFLNKLEV